MQPVANVAVTVDGTGQKRGHSSKIGVVFVISVDTGEILDYSVKWAKCSKTKFCGARRVRIAACETIAVFNTGAGSKAVTMELCHVAPGVNTMKAFRKQDQSRVKSASQKISSKYRKQRQNLRAKKKGKRDDTAYQSGGFSLSSHPDKCVAKKRKGRGKSTKGQNNEKTVVEQVDVVFIQPEYEFTAPKRVRSE